MKVTLVNHAGVLVTAGKVTVLCDPWLTGTVFNDGWALIVPTPFTAEQAMQGVTHIWLSHEHPDHFSTQFFRQIAPQYAGRVPLLFQKTRDGRVAHFCRGLGFDVIEIDSGRSVPLGDGVTAQMGRVGFYDSWLLLRDAQSSLLNLNDCAVKDRASAVELLSLNLRPDILLTQFSYAAWNGGRDKPRKALADAILRRVDKQIRMLKPRFVIPFASLARFAHADNIYLNDAMNTPADAADTISAAQAEPIILFPGDGWDSDLPYDNAPALARFAPHYAAHLSWPQLGVSPSVPLTDLMQKFQGYCARIARANSLPLIRLLHLLGYFPRVNIRLTDLDVTVDVSVVDGIRTSDAKADAAMRSDSLAFLFDHDFGFDTLMVNGRFEAGTEGFARLAKGLGLGSLNAMGLALSPRLLTDPAAIRGMLHWISSTRVGIA